MQVLTVQQLMAILAKYPANAIVLTEAADGRGTVRGVSHTDTDFNVVKDYPWRPQDWNWQENSHEANVPCPNKATYVCIK